MLSAFPNEVMHAAVDSTASRSGFLDQLNAFERLGRGAMLVGADARVLERNACVRLCDGLQVSQGFLRAAQPPEQRRLQRFLSAILSGSPVSANTLALPRLSGLRPWLLDGIDCSDTARGDARPTALLLITDVERPAQLTAELLGQVFGLTVTEANLARELASGKSLSQAAAVLTISAGHARQRLKAIFDKTNTARQGELVALLAKLD